MKDDFVFVDEFVSGVRWDAKYATWDNFTGKPVDGYLANRIVGTRALCATLERAREKAESTVRTLAFLMTRSAVSIQLLGGRVMVKL